MHKHVIHNAGTVRVSKTKLLRDLSTTSLILQDEGKLQRNERQILASLPHGQWPMHCPYGQWQMAQWELK